MWKHDIAIASSAQTTCTTLAVCMSERPWSKFGNSSTTPEMHSTTLKKHTRPQNSAFSPALKRPDGTCAPVLESIPPNTLIHWKSYIFGRLSRRKRTMKSGRLSEEQRRDEVVQVLGEDGEPREQRVAQDRQQHVLAERDDRARSMASDDEADRHRPVRKAVQVREAPDEPARRACRAGRSGPRQL